jgi:hypothetical protein
MSYDLMVFDPAAAPDNRVEFLAWFNQQTEWTENLDYNDPDNLSPVLRSWFMDFIQTFPPMNGPLAGDDYDDPHVTDYSLARGLVYAAFAWSQCELAYRHMFQTAAKHKIGFFNASSSEAWIWVPSASGSLEKITK